MFISCDRQSSDLKREREDKRLPKWFKGDWKGATRLTQNGCTERAAAAPTAAQNTALVLPTPADQTAPAVPNCFLVVLSYFVEFSFIFIFYV